MKRQIIYACSLAAALVAGGCEKQKQADNGAADEETTVESGDDSKPAAPEGAEGETEELTLRPPTAEDLATYTADLGEGKLGATLVTNQGTIRCELAEDKAPITVANFVGLARGLHPWRDPETREIVKRPFYEGLIFHRVIPGFMIQGGDPEGEGTGGPGYKFKTETSPDLPHDRAGTMSMANSGPNTNGSQFFITDKATSNLDGGYNVFGYCQDTDVVAKIARVETVRAPGSREKAKPVQDVVIERIEIYRGEPKAEAAAKPAEAAPTKP